MYRSRGWIVAAGLIAVAGCATDSSCGCRQGLLGRLTGHFRGSSECCPCPVAEDSCCDSGVVGSPYFGAPGGVEAFSPPAFDAFPAQPLPPTSQPMAKPVPYVPNGK